jgi:hypothetical protein
MVLAMATTLAEVVAMTTGRTKYSREMNPKLWLDDYRLTY